MGIHLFRFLRNATGETSAIGDYRAAPEAFTYTATESIEINRMIVYIEDQWSPDAGKYGNGLALENGIMVQAIAPDGSVFLDLTDGVPVKTNAQWARNCHDVTPHTFGESTAKAVSARWTFGKSGRPVVLPVGYTFAVTLNDDFRKLTDHTFKLDGAT